MKRYILLIAALVTLFPNPMRVSALEECQSKVLSSGIEYFDCVRYDRNCSVSGSTNSAIPTGDGVTLEGHTLPAASGGVGREERAVLQNGRAVLAPGTSNPGAGLNPAPAGATDNDAKFYIAMRWRYSIWAWD